MKILLSICTILLAGCQSANYSKVRNPDVVATMKMWRTTDGIVSHVTVDGVTHATTFKFSLDGKPEKE